MKLQCCGLCCKSKSELINHRLSEKCIAKSSEDDIDQMQEHVRERSKQCHMCTLSFPSVPRLKQHIRTHFSERPYKCETCGKTFKHSGDLNHHFKIKHPDLKPECDQCKIVFSCLSLLMTHEVSAHGRNPVVPTTITEAVNSVSIKKKQPKKSVESAHAQIGDIDESVKNGGARKRQRKSFLCYVCGRNCFTTARLERHMRTHTGARPFQCDLCGAAYQQSNDLVIHQRKHTGEVLNLLKKGAR